VSQSCVRPPITRLRQRAILNVALTQSHASSCADVTRCNACLDSRQSLDTVLFKIALKRFEASLAISDRMIVLRDTEPTSNIAIINRVSANGSFERQRDGAAASSSERSSSRSRILFCVDPANSSEFALAFLRRLINSFLPFVEPY